jgi:hypothetical protein
MPIVLPELRIGKPKKCGDWVVYPLFEAQQRFFHDDSYADIACIPVEFYEEEEMVAFGQRPDREGDRQPTVTNKTDNPLLLMAGTMLATSHVLTVPILVPARVSVVVPALCRADSTGKVVRSGRVVPGAQGAIIVAGQLRYFHLFGGADLCRRAWHRVLMAQPCRGQKLPPGELEGLVGRARSLSWKGVTSVGYGRESVAMQPGLRGFALRIGRKLIYLRIVFKAFS